MAVTIWTVIVVLAAVYGMLLGFGGPRFAIAIGIAAALFGFELFLALPSVQNTLQGSFGTRLGILAPLVPLGLFLIYSVALGNRGSITVAGAAYVIAPALILATSAGKPPGTWEDYLAIVAIWLPIEFRWTYHLFPYPPPLTHTLAILLALSTGVAAFILVRRLDGVGYALDWRRGYFAHFVLLFILFAAIAIPLGMKIGFIHWAPSFKRLRVAPLTLLGILFFTAWPEEFLFRGLLQNLLSKTVKSSWLGLFVAAVVFGFSHILHAPFPNWKYVALASIAGVFYGLAWMRTRSLVPGVLIHALVDISWHILFR
ncbi:MAG: type II CAAX endopeptidase family protein [Candidatus Acidiferrales bacterium]